MHAEAAVVLEQARRDGVVVVFLHAVVKVGAAGFTEGALGPLGGAVAADVVGAVDLGFAGWHQCEQWTTTPFAAHATVAGLDVAFGGYGQGDGAAQAAAGYGMCGHGGYSVILV